jgi:hypothetical protein
LVGLGVVGKLVGLGVVGLGVVGLGVVDALVGLGVVDALVGLGVVDALVGLGVVDALVGLGVVVGVGFLVGSNDGGDVVVGATKAESLFGVVCGTTVT